MQEKQPDRHLRQLWNTSQGQLTMDDVHAALDTFRSHRQVYQRKRHRRVVALRFMRYAALLLLPVLTAIVAWDHSARQFEAGSRLVELYVPHGEVDSVSLSDQTKVILNAGSSIIYPTRFNSHSHSRDVYVNGNCHFSVAKDASHPFIVNMGRLKVKVLGTQFSVDSYTVGEKITVTLEEGAVEAYDNRQRIRLEPNEQLVYDCRNGKMVKSKIDALAVNSWVKGGLYFSAQSLSAILATLERRFDVRFSVMPGIDVDKRYTMNFSKEEPLTNVLRVLAMVSGNIRHTQNGDTITLYPDGKDGEAR